MKSRPVYSGFGRHRLELDNCTQCLHPLFSIVAFMVSSTIMASWYCLFCGLCCVCVSNKKSLILPVIIYNIIWYNSSRQIWELSSLALHHWIVDEQGWASANSAPGQVHQHAAGVLTQQQQQQQDFCGHAAESEQPESRISTNARQIPRIHRTLAGKREIKVRKHSCVLKFTCWSAGEHQSRLDGAEEGGPWGGGLTLQSGESEELHSTCHLLPALTWRTKWTSEWRASDFEGDCDEAVLRGFPAWFCCWCRLFFWVWFFFLS